MNKVYLSGTLYDDPALTDLPNGTKCANFRISVSHRDKNGIKYSVFPACAWNERADIIMDSLKKGDRVAVAGYLTQRDGGNLVTVNELLFHFKTER